MKGMFLPRDVTEMFDIDFHPGYIGAFTTNHAPGAIENDIIVTKQNSEEGDGNSDGTQGVVLGSIRRDPIGIGYFVEWDEWPGHAVFVIAKKIRIT